MKLRLRAPIKPRLLCNGKICVNKSFPFEDVKEERKLTQDEWTGVQRGREAFDADSFWIGFGNGRSVRLLRDSLVTATT